ncbi:GPW/gp25 family protein [Leptolyngbya sp. FACHB-17]|uniref:GPW/gp25 family protein n=1 Tax=unclassified Leptolyngbya TaxID=2650499 RepID=UPI0016805C28|nr:GPW/gp25 family protein [Leptolyngbya sp. FACHB-17]MBD2080946.1 GPW/gp25 family protein [Leptolyngbya sp. FACHB-17]
MQINYPFYIDGRGRSAEVDYDPHIRQMIEQVLFTEPGQRVNRPDFGSGLQQLIFAPNATELAAAVQLLVQGAIEQWLGDLILLEAVDVERIDSRLEVTVLYIVRQNQQRQMAKYSKEVP